MARAVLGHGIGKGWYAVTLMVMVVGRIVPLLFAAAAVLIVGRALFDRYRSGNPLLAKVVFVGSIAVGAVVLGPHVMRSASSIGGAASFMLGRWEDADDWFALHERLGGHKSPNLVEQWAIAANNLGRFELVHRLLAPLVADPRTPIPDGSLRVELLSMAYYFNGCLTCAHSLLGALPQRHRTAISDYLEGRLAERSGLDKAAMRAYESSLARYKGFFPAAYQLARLRALGGDKAGFWSLVEQYPQLSNEIRAAKVGAAAEGEMIVLPAKELRIVLR